MEFIYNPFNSNSDSFGRNYGGNPLSKDNYVPMWNSSAGQQDRDGLFVNSSVNNKDATIANLDGSKTTPFIYHYPEEIENPLSKSNFSETPPNILRISIKDLEGGTLISELGTILKDTIPNVAKVSTDLVDTYIGDNTGDKFSKLDNVANILDNIQSIGKSVSNNFALNITEKTKYVPIEPTITYGTIYLYAPNNVETHYGFQYTSTDLTPTYKALDILAGAANGDTNRVVDALVQSGVGGIAGVVSNILNKIPGSETALGGKIDLKSLIQAKTRLVPLENLEYLFNRTDRRQFVYNFKFYPKSQKEIKTIFKIISALKYYSHPEISAGNSRYLKSPSIFDLQFCSLLKDGEGAYSYKDNLYINKIKPCALTDISINYTDVGRFSTLKPLDMETFATGVFKSPVGIDVNITFQELQILTRADFIHPEQSFKNIDEKKYY